MFEGIIRNTNHKFNKKFISYFVLINLLFSQSNILSEEKKNNVLKNVETSILNKANNYLLGPGDGIYILSQNLPEYSGFAFIGPDGYLNMPGTSQNIYAEGLTKSELNKIINKKQSEFVKNPIIVLKLVAYRPIRVYVKGEVSRPGLYTLRGTQTVDPTNNEIENKNFNFIDVNRDKRTLNTASNQIPTLQGGYTAKSFPTVYDALITSQGITPYSNLSEVQVIRKVSKSGGSEKIMATLNFVNLFKDGDLSQNIRIFDQDVIFVPKSDKVLIDQLIEANKSNLSPDFLNVFVTGNIQKGGQITVPRGAGLNQAIAIAGGNKLLSGRIEFLRYGEGGIVEKRSFNLKKSAKLNTYKNPILKKGDIININRSIVGKTSDVLGEVISPVVNSYTIYKIFTD
tara:strand:- start:878 stop:2074 length:1197 start_codon:yes stop_codon:yes gene_type:complete